MYLLGIDVGTSVIKAALFSADGQELVSCQQPMQLLQPQSGWMEADMQATWQTCCAVIRAVLESPEGQGREVAAVGVTGNMIGAWLVDEHGEPVRNAILWCDSRTQPLWARLTAEQPDLAERIFAMDGCVVESGATLLVLRWLRDHEPQALERARWVFSSKDWIVYKLSGVPQIDSSEAAVLPGDTRIQHSPEILWEWFGILPQRALLPPVQPSERVIGQVQPAAAALTGLKVGTPVIAGAGDVPANSLGLGATEPGTAFMVLGTNLQVCRVFEQPMFEPRLVGLLFYQPHGRWFRALMNVAGTTNLDWAIKQFYADLSALEPAERFKQVEEQAASRPIGADGVLYLPYLSRAGVIAPFVAPKARAQFVGLHDGHTRADLVRAVYEGVAFAARDCYSALGELPRQVIFAGGGARSTFWAQLMADCLGATVIVPHGREFGAKGAALLAGVGVGMYDDIRSACRCAFRPARMHTPDLSAHAHYTAHFAYYCAVQRSAKLLW
ncbi:MAG: FGGY-family carbohydrate kinase [Anaerolineae bacterium]|nr:FGGY-family carbohydrate kinase [Anaerolineae bacterium]